MCGSMKRVLVSKERDSPHGSFTRAVGFLVGVEYRGSVPSDGGWGKWTLHVGVSCVFLT